MCVGNWDGLLRGGHPAPTNERTSWDQLLEMFAAQSWPTKFQKTVVPSKVQTNDDFVGNAEGNQFNFPGLSTSDLLIRGQQYMHELIDGHSAIMNQFVFFFELPRLMLQTQIWQNVEHPIFESKWLVFVFNPLGFRE